MEQLKTYPYMAVHLNWEGGALIREAANRPEIAVEEEQRTAPHGGFHNFLYLFLFIYKRTSTSSLPLSNFAKLFVDLS